VPPDRRIEIQVLDLRYHDSCIIVVFANLFTKLAGRYAHGQGTKSIMAKCKKYLVAA